MEWPNRISRFGKGLPPVEVPAVTSRFLLRTPTLANAAGIWQPFCPPNTQKTPPVARRGFACCHQPSMAMYFVLSTFLASFLGMLS